MAAGYQSARFQTPSGFAPLIPRCGIPKSSFQRLSWSPNVSKISEMAKGSSTRRLPHCRAIHRTGSILDLDVMAAHSIQPTQLVSESNGTHTLEAASTMPYTFSEHLNTLVLADLDPATAKLAVGLVGPLLSGFGFLFIIRIVMSWYPKLPVGKFPYIIAYAPTEPLLSPTRKLIKPVGGVDVSPVVWFAIISFLNEILVGPQGLLVLLSQQV